MILLAVVTGRLSVASQLVSQSSVPNAKREYMEKEIQEVFFVWMIIIALG